MQFPVAVPLSCAVSPLASRTVLAMNLSVSIPLPAFRSVFRRSAVPMKLSIAVPFLAARGIFACGAVFTMKPALLVSPLYGSVRRDGFPGSRTHVAFHEQIVAECRAQARADVSQLAFTLMRLSQSVV